MFAIKSMSKSFEKVKVRNSPENLFLTKQQEATISDTLNLEGMEMIPVIAMKGCYEGVEDRLKLTPEEDVIQDFTPEFGPKRASTFKPLAKGLLLTDLVDG